MPNAVVHPGTMVIHQQHTLPAHRAMVCPKRFERLAFPAVLQILPDPDLVHLSSQNVLFSTIMRKECMAHADEICSKVQWFRLDSHLVKESTIRAGLIKEEKLTLGFH